MAYQVFTTCSLESRDISLFSFCIADFSVKVMRGEGWGGVENPDTSLVRRLKHSCQYRNTKSKKRRNSQTKTNKKESGQNKSKTKGGEGESVEKPDTSLARQFKHLNRKQEEPKKQQHKKSNKTAQMKRRPRR